MTLTDRVLGAALATAAMAGIVWASHAPMTSHDSPDAVLRLAWSARPERVETCREQSDEELARLPQHMRQRVVCEGAAAHYRLTVQSGNQVIAEQFVRAGGLRQDRRLYVFREIALPAGEAAVEVRFDRIEPGPHPIAGATDRETVSEVDRRQYGETVPPRLTFKERLHFAPRAVILVTYDPERRELVAVRDAARAVR